MIIGLRWTLNIAYLSSTRYIESSAIFLFFAKVIAIFLLLEIFFSKNKFWAVWVLPSCCSGWHSPLNTLRGFSSVNRWLNEDDLVITGKLKTNFKTIDNCTLDICREREERSKLSTTQTLFRSHLITLRTKWNDHPMAWRRTYTLTYDTSNVPNMCYSEPQLFGSLIFSQLWKIALE